MNIQRYPTLLILIGLLIGLFWSDAFGVFSIILLVLIAIVGVYTLFTKNINRNLLYIRSLGIVSLSCILAIILSQQADIRRQHDWYGNHITDSSFITIKINNSASEKNKTVQYSGKITSVINDNQSIETQGYVNLYLYKNDSMPDYSYRTIVIPNKLSIISNSGNPNAFDYKRYLSNQNQFHQIFISNEEIITVSALPDVPFVERLRNKLMLALQQNISDSTTLTLAQTVLLNERKSIDEQVQNAYSKTGIVHIIAISGMHITIMLWLLMGALFFVKDKRYAWIKYLVALPIVWLYILITHSPASAVRAGIMFTIVAGAIAFSKHQNNINTLIVTAILMLLYKPQWVYDVGMQLSFLCMLSIFIFYEPIKSLLQPKTRILQWLWESLAMSIAVQVLVTPLVIYYFYQFPIWTFIANIPAAIYSTIFLIGILIVSIIGSFGISISWLGDILIWITNAFNQVIFILSEWTPKTFTLIHLDTVGLIIFTLSLLLISLGLFVYRKKIFINAGLLSLIILMIYNIYLDGFLKEQQQLIFYNIANEHIVALKNEDTWTLLSSDTLTDKDYKFNVLPGLVKNRVGYTDTVISRSFSYQNKLYYAYNKDISYQTNFPVPLHTLIISEYDKNSIAHANLLSPKRIILSSSLKRWQANKLEKMLNNDYEVYNIHTKGALIE